MTACTHTYTSLSTPNSFSCSSSPLIEILAPTVDHCNNYFLDLLPHTLFHLNETQQTREQCIHAAEGIGKPRLGQQGCLQVWRTPWKVPFGPYRISSPTVIYFSLIQKPVFPTCIMPEQFMTFRNERGYSFQNTGRSSEELPTSRAWYRHLLAFFLLL